MNSNKYCVIIAGGLGSSFWPITNKKMPKQFLDLLGCGKTFVRQAYERIIQKFDINNIFLITNKEYVDIVLEQIPELCHDNILLEPLARNTAASIAYASFKINEITPDAIISFIPSGNYITNDNAYLNDIETCIEFAKENDGLITIGITPTRAETNYGYIQIKDNINTAEGILKVKTFTEKPNIELATAFYESKEFLWNSSIIVCQVNTILNEYKEYMPLLYNLLNQSGELNTEHESAFISGVYENIHNISISTGIMEHSSKVYVMRSTFGWSALSSWKAFYSKSEKDENLNVISKGNAYFSEAHNCIVKTSPDKNIVIQGIDNIIVAENGQFILICNRKDENKIKNFEKIFRLKD